MSEKYSKLLVTKLNKVTHDKLKELAKQDRRTLSGMSRLILEDYVERSCKKIDISKEQLVDSK